MQIMRNGILVYEDHAPSMKVTLENGVKRGIHFEDIECNSLDFREADFRGGHFPKCHFRHALLQQANFRDADLRGVDFTDANLRDADLRGARLDNACFHKANMGGTRFDCWDDFDALALTYPRQRTDVVRVVLPDGVHEATEEVRVFIRALQEIGWVRIHRDDKEGMCFDLKTGCEYTTVAEKLTKLFYNAVRAPAV